MIDILLIIWAAGTAFFAWMFSYVPDDEQDIAMVQKYGAVVVFSIMLVAAASWPIMLPLTVFYKAFK